MRPIHVLLGLAVVLASAGSALLTVRLASSQEHGQPEVAVLQAATSGIADPSSARATEDKLAYMAARLDAISSELEQLRNAASRAPVEVPQAAGTQATAANVAVSEVQRATVLAVLAEDKAREAAEAQAKRDADERQNAERRAARIAKELTLSPGDETRLAGLMFDSGRKRQELFESMRNGNFDREVARTQFETFRTWQTDQLTQAFGAPIAEQILASEGDRMGFGGGPGGPGGGQGGQAGGRGARRAGQNAGGASGAGGGAQQN